MKIIGFVGLIGSGKDTVANMFVESTRAAKDSFAAPLKDATSAIFGWERALLEGDTEESRSFRETPDMFWSKKLEIPEFTPRLALQLLGTDVLRNHFNEAIWINSMEYRMRANHADNEIVVVSDARFQNEIQLIKDLGGQVVWVRRGDLPEWFDIAVKANTGDLPSQQIMCDDYSHIHRSEWDWAGVEADHVVYNNLTLEDLSAQVDLLSDIITQRIPH